MIIRKAKDSDLEQIRTLYQHLHPSEPMLPATYLRAAWLSLLTNPCTNCFVLELDKQLLSTCTLIVVPNLTRSARPYALIENVVTHADHRRNGYGSALLQAALIEAWKLGCYKVMLMTGSRNPETLQFYERIGFISGQKTAFIARPE